MSTNIMSGFISIFKLNSYYGLFHKIYLKVSTSKTETETVSMAALTYNSSNYPVYNSEIMILLLSCCASRK